MTAIAVPALGRDVYRRSEKHFGVEDLVLEQAGEGFLETLALVDDRAAHQQATGARYGSDTADHACDHLGRRDNRIWGDAECRSVVEQAILRPAGPTEPVQRVSIHTAHLWKASHDFDLLRELAGKPKVVGIEKGYILAFRLLDRDVTRGTVASVSGSIMLQVPDLFGVLQSIFTSQCNRLPARAIVHQQELPLGIALRQDTLDRRAHECHGWVQERHHDGDQPLSSRFHWAPPRRGIASHAHGRPATTLETALMVGNTGATLCIRLSRSHRSSADSTPT